jgi:DNA-nicking Smr family endonuclease
MRLWISLEASLSARHDSRDGDAKAAIVPCPSTDPGVRTIAYACAMGARDKHTTAADLDADMDDARLFRSAIGQVRPLAATEAAPRRPRPSPRPAMLEADERAALEASRRESAADAGASADAIEFRRDEIAANTLRRLKRGDFSVQDEFDLHQLDAATAEAALGRFLQEARASDRRCVLVVHGKGLHSPRGPVLKMLVERVLARRADVLAYASAPPAQGGTGAVLVLLATPPKRRA